MQVLSRNANSKLAYNGIGKAYTQGEEYTDALQYLRYSGDKYSYSKAFGKNRLVVVRKYGPYFIAVVVCLVLALSVRKRIVRRKKK